MYPVVTNQLPAFSSTTAACIFLTVRFQVPQFICELGEVEVMACHVMCT